MISSREIEANPDKVKAILNMESPKIVREVQRLTGRLAALNRFLSKSAQQGLPFFKVLKKANRFEWDSECQEAFDQLKEHLRSLPTLVSPMAGEALFLYLAIAEEAVSAVLVTEESKIQYPIYYVSRALSGLETRYTSAEKFAIS